MNRIICSLACSIFAVLLFVEPTVSQESLVGTFYGGWPRNKGNYIWAGDLGQGARLITVGDVDGDGFEDAIISTDGVWEVALSESYTDLSGKNIRHFGKKKTWLQGFGAESDNLLVGDLNGNSLADLAVFCGFTGNWAFAYSDGNSFVKTQTEIKGFGIGSSHQFLADVNGDGLADAIAYTSGRWEVAINNRKGFDRPLVFADGFGDDGSTPYVADVTGDGRSDAISVHDGRIHVAQSDGISFVASTNAWLTIQAFDGIRFADGNGDKKADAILYHEHYREIMNQGRWEIAVSNGRDGFSEPVFWCDNHGSADVRGRPMKGLPAGHRFFTGYVQTPNTGPYGVSPIVFNDVHGFWQVMPPYKMFSNDPYEPGSQPRWYCSWHVHNRGGLPLTGSDYYGFDAEDDSFAIAELIKELADAGIDFVLFDQTNNWDVLLKAYQVFAGEISKWNRVPGNRRVRYAICGSYKRHASEVERSAERTISDFLYNSEYGGKENYQYIDGKPLLVCYGGVENKHIDWEHYEGAKINADKFTLKWMDGGGTRENSIGPQKGDWYGWHLPEGTIENPDQMVVQPGFHSGHAGRNWSSRLVDGIEGDRYRKLGWDKVLLNQPKAVTIISFVGDAEQNDVYHMRTGDYPHDMGKTEHWSYPGMYWEMTKDYIKNYRELRQGKIECVGEYGRASINDSCLVIRYTAPFSVSPVVYVSLEGIPEASVEHVQIAAVSTDSFTVSIMGTGAHTGMINWLAVLPGYWETPNGIKVAAGNVCADQYPVTIKLRDHFKAAPALFSMAIPLKNNDPIITMQSEVSAEAFTLGVSFLSGEAERPGTIGWIAIETGMSDMWSGRFCSALTLKRSDETMMDFTLPRYFYDRVLTLVKSSSGNAGTSLPVIVDSTTNLGGVIRYPSSASSLPDTINLVSFDGGGGRLYGKTR